MVIDFGATGGTGKGAGPKVRPRPITPRCDVCGWALQARREEGCVKDDCSFRPNARGSGNNRQTGVNALKFDRASMRTFHLLRTEDETGISGTGKVAWGVEFPNGKVAIAWNTEHTSVAVYDNIKSAIAIHGHNGKTVFVFADNS